MVYSNNPDSHEIAGLILGLSQNEHGQAIRYQVLGGVSFIVQLEIKHTSAKDALTARKYFVSKALSDAERFIRTHKFFNIPVNSQIIDAPDFEHKVTRAIPDCIG